MEEAMRRSMPLLALLLVPALALAGGLDGGKVDPGWFGNPDLTFKNTETVDYLWVKPGFSVEGKTIQVAPWQDPVFLGKKRDAKDSAKAVDLTDRMSGLLRGGLTVGLEGTAKVSREAGDYKLEGRVVDVNAGSKGAKWMVGFGAGSAAATWDIKITDAATGELLVAIHHRSISGTMMSEIEDKIAKWVEALGPDMKAGFASYGVGKPAKE
jgi:hypothetical protein